MYAGVSRKVTFRLSTTVPLAGLQMRYALLLRLYPHSFPSKALSSSFLVQVSRWTNALAPMARKPVRSGSKLCILEYGVAPSRVKWGDRLAKYVAVNISSPHMNG